MADKTDFEALEKEELHLIRKLDLIRRAKHVYLSTLPKLFISSNDDEGAYEEGFYAIDAPSEIVERVSKVESNFEGNVVVLKTEKTIDLEIYFTKEEIDSLRRLP